MPKKEKIQQMFDGIAPDYDRLNHLMSLGVDRSWRRRALREIVVPGRSREILDIACGTGDFSIAIARKLPSGGLVTGLDLSEGMLAVMRRKVEKAGLARTISCMQGDSETMPFADGSFDVATIAFGIRNFEHREAALQEILRVLRPGGRLVILELSVPENKLLRWCYNLYFMHFVPWIGGLISGDKAAYKYLPASVQQFPGRREWTATMVRCGYTQVRHKAFTFGLCRMYVGEKKTN
ncbi:MAG: bifunctional demethylmenaquinone methyltransferase/2-methoxy-6-polyprenyl-1,4-benzoquinol methylase UbiE [Bacteroidales bacterium]|nr:bifunctional demethylmenaquinone methyltransferase/2-methoxy-6-polyprenyl-1,4-benzoquinol methylase UbiE [Bacteroidales bacterium]